MIKDSGNRQEFSTGAVRDMREGKGRLDLVPLSAFAKVWCDDAHIFTYLVAFQESGFTQSRELIQALRLFIDHAYKDYPDALLEVSVHFEEGAKKYGENNWQKGIPLWCYFDSAVRHFLKFERGDTDERHDRAFVWNILCCLYTMGSETHVKLLESL